MIHVQLTVTRTHLLSLFGLIVLAVVLIPAVARGGNQFTDVGDSNIFHTDIAWMADEGITEGCNPPANDEYCPSDTVTREQMAAFMHRLYTNKIAPLETANTSLTSRVETLETANTGLQALLAGVTRNGDILTFTAMNLQVVNGQGSTTSSNGLGNVIIGYNEDTGGDETRTGSHYLIVGNEHTWTAFGGIVTGFNNTATGSYTSVTGGSNNTAGNMFASVSGGYNNTASGSDSSVSGGTNNTASGSFASVSGGSNNTAGNMFTSVSGGYTNTASGVASSVSGGGNNTASGSSSSILGGSGNTVNTDYGIFPS